MSAIHEKSLGISDVGDQEQLALKVFNHNIAFDIGSEARRLVLENFPNSKAVAIDITLASGITIYRTSINGLITSDNEDWINKKRNTVLRFGRSSKGFSLELSSRGRTLESKNLNPTQYTIYGGGFPIKVEATGDVVVAVLTVSGLTDVEDHNVAYFALKNIAAQSSHLS